MTNKTATETNLPILVIGDDMRIFLSVARALGRAGKIVHAFPFAKDAPALASRYIARIHDAPSISILAVISFRIKGLRSRRATI
jgi:hypothetical protein